MLTTMSGSFTSVRKVNTNAHFPMPVTLSPNVTFVSPVLENAHPPMFVTLLGIVTCFRFWHVLNAQYPISVNPAPMVTFCKLAQLANP